MVNNGTLHYDHDRSTHFKANIEGNIPDETFKKKNDPHPSILNSDCLYSEISVVKCFLQFPSK